MQGGCLGFLSPGKVVAARMRAGTLGSFQPKLLLLRPVMEHLGLSRRSRALVGGVAAAAAPVVSALASFREKTLLVAFILLCGV